MKQQLLIWDRFIRFFHWSVASLFFLNYFITEDDLHEWFGYSILALLGMRFLWGFIGTQNARFINFFPSRSRIQTHIAQLRQREFNPSEGHNPVGALMIMFLLLMLFVTAFSGWMLEWEQFWGEEWLESTHEISADIVMVAICIHVSAVIIVSHLLNTNLIKTMVTGKRPDRQ